MLPPATAYSVLAPLITTVWTIVPVSSSVSKTGNGSWLSDAGVQEQDLKGRSDWRTAEQARGEDIAVHDIFHRRPSGAGRSDQRCDLRAAGAGSGAGVHRNAGAFHSLR